jgi:hypothetical protein
MLYLIYTTEEDANTRADQEGTVIEVRLLDSRQGYTLAYSTSVPTLEGNYALDVTNYELSDVEKTETVPSYNPVPPEEE